MQILSNNKIRVLWIALLALAVLLLPHFLLAAEPEGAQNDPDMLDALGRWIGNIVLSIASYITWICGKLLDTSMTEVVLEMGEKLNSNSSAGGAIENAWEVIRDISNLAFIFGFVWVGIMTIFDYESANTKRMLASIIIGAILINFSLFFTRVVIDTSNLMATEIYQTMVGQDLIGQNSTQRGIGLVVAERMGISTIYKSGEPDTFKRLAEGGTVWYYIGAAIFLFIAAFVFAAGGILLIIRFVALVAIMIFSPILFAATVFQGTKAAASKLWSLLFRYAFFAPIYLLFIYMSLRVIDGYGGGTNAQDLQAALTNVEGYEAVVTFTVISVFMILAIIAAQKLSLYGGDKAVSTGQRVARSVRGATIYGAGALTGMAGRRFIGKYADSADKRAEEAGVSELSGRRRVLSGVANSKFGSRHSYKQVDAADKKAEGAKERAGQVEETYDKIQQGTTAPAGEAGDKARIEMERSVADKNTEQLLAILKKNLSPEEYQKFVASLSSSQFDSLMKAKDTDLDDGAKGKLAKARQAAVEQLFEGNVEDLRKASIDQLTQLGAEYLEDESRVIHLNSSQMDKLKEKLTSTEFGRLNTARTNALEQIARGSDPSHILNQKPGEIAKMPAKVLTQLSDRLPVSALSKIASEGTLSQEDQASIRGGIEGSIQAAPNLSASQAYKDWLENDRIGKQFGK